MKLKDSNPDLFHAIDTTPLQIPGRERGEQSPTCASVPQESDRLVSSLVSMVRGIDGDAYRQDAPQRLNGAVRLLS